MKRLLLTAALVIGAFSFAPAAKAGPGGVITGSVAVCDPNAPSTCMSLKGGTPTSAQVTCDATGTVSVFSAYTGTQPPAAQIIVNNSGSTVYLGPSGVSSSTGFAVPSGMGFDATHALGGLYCATAASTAVIGTLKY